MGELPEGAKKVFSGVIFNVHQWDQQMYDGTTEVFERISRGDTVEAIVVTQEGKLLIQKQQQPDREEWFLSSVGGRVDEGEEPLGAMKRELKEETGYTSDDVELISTYRPSSKLMWNIYTYVARGCVKTHEQDLDAGEKIEVLEVGLDEYIELIDSGKLERFAAPIREMCIRAKYHEPSKEKLRKQLFG